MDPLPLVWLSSILGAGLFSSAGYLYGKRSAADAVRVDDAAERPTAPGLSDLPSVAAGPDDDYSQEEETKVGVVSDHIARAATPSAAHHVWREQIDAAKAELATRTTELEAALAQLSTTEEKARDAEGAKADLERALAEASASAEQARNAEAAARQELSAHSSSQTAAAEKLQAAEAGNAELARHLEVVRNELRDEVIARATANARADELGDRLARASEETASLRHKLSQQVKQMRDGFASSPPRRRDDSLPPGASASQRPAARVSAPPSHVTASAPPRPTEDAALQAEVARLAAENRDLRARVLGSIPPKRPSRASAPDLDLDVYRALVERLGGANGAGGARCAVIADEVGSLLVGSGDLAEGLAAFGAYIRDASSRTERLLPLDGVEEIDIRDRRGTVLSTRLITRVPTELSLVLLGNEGASVDAAKRIAEETLKLRP